MCVSYWYRDVIVFFFEERDSFSAGGLKQQFCKGVQKWLWIHFLIKFVLTCHLLTCKVLLVTCNAWGATVNVFHLYFASSLIQLAFRTYPPCSKHAQSFTFLSILACNFSADEDRMRCPCFVFKHQCWSTWCNKDISLCSNGVLGWYVSSSSSSFCSACTITSYCSSFCYISFKWMFFISNYLLLVVSSVLYILKDDCS